MSEENVATVRPRPGHALRSGFDVRRAWGLGSQHEESPL